MTKQDVIQTLHQLGIRPSRRLGQNFLVDPNMIAALIRAANPRPGEPLLEIGPGLGAMTGRLLAAGAGVTAIEYDRRLCHHLERIYGDAAGFRLVEADGCRVNYDDLMASGRYRCVSNLPYSSGSVMLARLIESRHPPDELYLLLQHEMARRLTATPGNTDYGALSVKVQLLYDARVVRRVPADVFYPRPAVDSSYVCLSRTPEAAPKPVRDAAGRLARLGFGHRRKRLASLLKKVWDSEKVATALSACGVADDIRAEKLSPDQYVKLARILGASDSIVRGSRA